jgi:hypothetical protein
VPRNVSARAEKLNPVSKHAYIDKVVVWLRQPLSHRRLQWLGSECRNGCEVRDEPANFDHRLVQRCSLFQPSPVALQSLASLEYTHTNYAEFSLDWAFGNADEREDAFNFVKFYFVQKYHRKNVCVVGEGARVVGEGGDRGTLYTGQRSARNKLVAYADRDSKHTGELNTVHLEWRLNGIGALRGIGIGSVRDLLSFDHRSFWLKRLLIYDLDMRAVGRQFVIHCTNKHRGAPGMTAYHLRCGSTLLRVSGSMQRFIDDHRNRIPDLYRHLRPVNVRHLLPAHYH